ncbi:MAG: HAD hydrolase-like protein [Daejeonella sp.]
MKSMKTQNNIPLADSFIFDMDGTLWDALDTYVTSWNNGFIKENIDRVITSTDLAPMIGWEKCRSLEHLLPDHDLESQEKVFNTIREIQTKLLSEVGGVLYEGVKEGLAQLSKKYKLFIVSNCAENGIKQFMEWAGISEYITDEMAHGVNGMPKHHNIKTLIEKYYLQTPVYVGNTETDSIESRKAGIPFVFMEGGFGDKEDYGLKFDDFKRFAEYFMVLK